MRNRPSQAAPAAPAAPAVLAAAVPVVLLDLATERYLALDEVGARVWSLLDGEHSRDHIADALAVEYEAPIQQITADVDAFLAQLSTLGLVQAMS